MVRHGPCCNCPTCGPFYRKAFAEQEWKRQVKAAKKKGKPVPSWARTNYKRAMEESKPKLPPPCIALEPSLKKQCVGKALISATLLEISNDERVSIPVQVLFWHLSSRC
jgi:hypothetical protein